MDRESGLPLSNLLCQQHHASANAIRQGKGLYGGWFDAGDDYADQTAIFVHSDKGFTTNELATRWLEDHFDAWTRDAADGRQRLLILDGH